MIPSILSRHHRILKLPHCNYLSNGCNNSYNNVTHFSTQGRSNSSSDFKYTKKKTSTNNAAAGSKVRLNKLISLNSHYSRREVAKLIKEGKVKIAGKEVTSPQVFYNVKDLTNALKINGKLIPISQKATNNGTENTKVWIAHKLEGEIVTHNDPSKRPSLIDRLIKGGFKKHSTSLFKTIGRLDMATEGLILLTNDGNYKQDMEIPSNQLHRKYRVRLHGNITDGKLQSMRRGVEWKGIQYKGVKVELEKEKGGRGKTSTNNWLTITCVEGKNRLVRNICECLGLQVTRLIRIAYGDYFLGVTPPGMVVPAPLKRIDDHKNRGSFSNWKGNKKPDYKKKPNDNLEIAKPVKWIKAKKHFTA